MLLSFEKSVGPRRLAALFRKLSSDSSSVAAAHSRNLWEL